MLSRKATPQWKGVDGLRRLFGSRGLRVIAGAEDERLRQLLRDFHHGTGALVTLQSDAYKELRLPTDMPYSLRAVLDDLLEARCKLDPTIPPIPLIGGPPTRRFNSLAARDALLRVKSRLMDGA